MSKTQSEFNIIKIIFEDSLTEYFSVSDVTVFNNNYNNLKNYLLFLKNKYTAKQKANLDLTIESNNESKPNNILVKTIDELLLSFSLDLNGSYTVKFFLDSIITIINKKDKNNREKLIPLFRELLEFFNDVILLKTNKDLFNEIVNQKTQIKILSERIEKIEKERNNIIKSRFGKCW